MKLTPSGILLVGTLLATSTASCEEISQIPLEEPALDFSSDTELDFEEIPVDESVEVQTTHEPTVVTSVEESEEPSPRADIAFDTWLGYNAKQSDTTWLVGQGNDLGILSFESHPTMDVGNDVAVVGAFGIHWLDGPDQTDMPPRLFDFQLALHSRKLQSDNMIFDLKLGIGAFSDFEGSARDGIRFPGHAVSYYQWSPSFLTVLGAEVFDRDDISLLPVAGVVLQPRDDLVMELVFPRPKISVLLNSGSAMYVSGEIGGGTWAVKRDSSISENATYSDIRVAAGIMSFGEEHSGTLEIGWAFDRELSFRSGLGNYQPEDGFFLRCRCHY